MRADARGVGDEDVTAAERRRSGGRAGALAAGLAVVVFAASACATSSNESATTTAPGGTQVEEDAGPPVAGGALVYGIGDESTGWNPGSDRWGPGPTTVGRALFDPLVVVGEDGTIHPWLAASFEPADDTFEVWHIDTRPGITFSNGEAVDAAAIALNLEDRRAAALSGITLKPVTGVEVLDADTVEVTVDRAWAAFPTAFVNQTGFIAAPAQLASGDNTKPIGSGPFTFQSWDRDSELVANKNPTYWRKDPDGQQLPYLDKVTFRVIPEESTRLTTLESGDADAIHTRSPHGVATLLGGDVPDGLDVFFDEGEGQELAITLNTQTGPTTDENLRKALNLATDRQAIVDFYDGAYEVAGGPFTADSPFSPPEPPAADIEAAKKLVADYEREHPEGARITLGVTSSTDNLEIAQLLQSQWSQAGIDVEVQGLEATKFSQDIVTGNYQAMMLGTFDGADPDINYSFMSGANIGQPGTLSLNFPRWTSAAADAGLDAARGTDDPDERATAYRKVWDEWAEHVPWVFLYHTKWAVASNGRVHGIDQVNLPDGTGNAMPIVLGSVNLSNAWLEPV